MTKRTGASLTQTVNTAPTATMLTLGFGEQQAARIIRTRRVLPLVDDPKEPQIDARKLWEKIGKPHRRFNDWAAHYIAPMLNGPRLFTEISVKVTQGAKGRPRRDYIFSRDMAAHLAMQANTPEGADIRAYFLDMERLALRLSEHMGVRVDAIVSTDNRMAHTLTKRAAEQSKAGTLQGLNPRAVALDRERRMKTIVCEVLTGHPPCYWLDTFGKRVRDVLDTADLLVYSQCLEAARVLVNGGIAREARLRAFLTESYGGAVSPTKYLPEMQQASTSSP